MADPRRADPGAPLFTRSDPLRVINRRIGKRRPMTSFDTNSPTMRTPFRPSALSFTAKLLAMVGMIALPYVVLTSMRPDRAPLSLAGATFTIDNSTDCAYTAVIHHSDACPAVSIPSTSNLSVPASTNGSSITVSGSRINKVELKSGSTIFATWTCTTGTSGSWAANADVCLLSGTPNKYARAQGNGYNSNKIEWQP